MILPKKLSGKTRVQLSRSARNWPMEEIISCLPWAKVVCVCLDRILVINIMSVELASWSYCRDGIGMGNSMFVYTLGKL